MTSVAPPTSTADAHKYGVLFVFAAGVLWSTVGLGIRMIEDAVVWQILLYRSISMSLFLYVVIRVRSGESPFVQIRRVGFPSVVAGLSLVAAFSGGIYSIQNTSVANAMLLFATAPFMAAVLGWIVLGERVRAATWVAIAVAIGGIAIMQRRPERQPCRAWIGIWLRGLHRCFAMGADRRNAPIGIPVRPIRHRRHIRHMPILGAIRCSQLARWHYIHGHGGFSGGCGTNSLHAGVTQPACSGACLALAG
jgi:uncharacterized membrane protein